MKVFVLVAALLAVALQVAQGVPVNHEFIFDGNNYYSFRPANISQQSQIAVTANATNEGDDQFRSALYNGQNVALGAYKFFAILFERRSDNRYYLRCSAVIISQRSVLTSAICSLVNDYRTLQIVPGVVDNRYLQNAAKYNLLEAPKRHISFNNVEREGYKYDIALCKTLSAIAFNNAVGSIILDNSGNTWPNAAVITLGFGRNNPNNGNSYSPYLQSLGMTNVALQQCQSVAGTRMTYNSLIHGCFKSNVNGGAVSTGDFGGPGILLSNNQWLLTHLTSHGFVPNQNFPTVTTIIKAMIPWIQQNAI